MSSLIEARRESTEGSQRTSVILYTKGRKPYTAVQMKIPEDPQAYGELGIHRSRGGNTGSTGFLHCPELAGQRCKFEVLFIGRDEVPLDPKEQVRALIEKLRSLHPSMVPKSTMRRGK